MSNPVLDRIDSMSTKRTPNGYPSMPGYQPGGAASQQPVNAASMQVPAGSVNMDSYEQMYAGPAGDAVDLGRVTYDDVLVKTASLFGVVLAGAVVSWYITAANPGVGMMLMTVGFIGGFVTALINIFKRQPSPVLILTYAVFEGLALGALSAVMEAAFPGVVMQAVVASLIVFAVSLGLFASGTVRNSPKLQMIGLVGIVSILLLQVANWLLTMFGAVSSPWGIEGGEIFGIPIAGLLGIAVVILGAISFIGDFDQVKVAVNRQMPQKVSWYLAFGMIVTLVWLYVNLLRYLAILSGRD